MKRRWRQRLSLTDLWRDWLAISGPLPDLEVNYIETIVRLIDPTARVPRCLYPQARLVTKRVRLGQLVFGHMRLIWLAFSRRNVALITGRALAFSSGWVEVADARSPWPTLLRSLCSRQPFLPIGTNQTQFADIFIGFGLDPGSSLKIFLNGNEHGVLAGLRDGRPCIVHFGRTAETRATVHRHAAGSVAARKILGSILERIIPSIYLQEIRRDTAVMIEQKIDGAVAEVPTMSEKQLARMLDSAVAPILEIHRRFSVRKIKFSKDYIRTIGSSLLDSMPHYSTCIQTGLELLKCWVERRDIDAVPAHGDYALHNILFGDSYADVLGIVDWEWFWEEAPAGFDAVKMAVEYQAARDQCRIFPVLALLFSECAEGQFKDILISIQSRFGLADEDVYCIGILIWLRVLWMGRVVTGHCSQEWLDEAVMTPGLALLGGESAKRTSWRFDATTC